MCFLKELVYGLFGISFLAFGQTGSPTGEFLVDKASVYMSLVIYCVNSSFQCTWRLILCVYVYAMFCKQFLGMY